MNSSVIESMALEIKDKLEGLNDAIRLAEEALRNAENAKRRLQQEVEVTKQILHMLYETDNLYCPVCEESQKLVNGKFCIVCGSERVILAPCLRCLCPIPPEADFCEACDKN